MGEIVSTSILQSAPDAIVCLDDRGVVREWNSAAEQLFGYPRAVAEGQTLETLLRLEIPELRPRPTGPPSARADVCCRGAGGTLIETEWSFAAVLDEAGTRTATIGIARAISETRGLERNLARAARAATVAEVTAAIVHQLSQPVGAILMTARTCLRGFERKTLTNDQITAALSRLSADAARASDTIAKVRALAQSSTSAPQLLSVNDVVCETLDVMRSEFRGGRIEIRAALGELPLVVADRGQLQQVIANLVSNAVQAMSAHADCPGVVLVRSIATGRDEVLIEVEDSGPGISPDMHDQVFAPFFTSRPNGLGLGLAVCKTIVEAHGGKIWAAPCARGACFVLSLPAAGSGQPSGEHRIRR